MISTITPLRRLAVTLVLTGATALGAVSIAPAALADESVPVTESAPLVEPAPVETPVVDVPVAETPVVEAPVVESAPVVEAPAVPAPVVVPPPAVVIGKDGKPVKAPKVCTQKDIDDLAAKVATATQQAAQLNRTAALLRQGAAVLRTQAAKLTGTKARLALDLAAAGELAASTLEAQGVALVQKAGVPTTCSMPLPGGGRF